uniref:Uncharacterized protein n=1 Tax=Anguilla anguilla TaxID=7936 RepID=A0A0E9SPN0_ANGAN
MCIMLYILVHVGDHEYLFFSYMSNHKNVLDLPDSE